MPGEAAREPAFDPRFDPRFQRGYEPATDAAPPSPEPGAPTDPVPAMEPDHDPGPGAGAAVAPGAPSPPDQEEPGAGGSGAQAETSSAADRAAVPVGGYGADRARPWLVAAWIVAAGVILTGAALVGIAVTSARVIRPTGTIDQAVMVQVTSFSIAPSLIEIGVIAVLVLLAVSGTRRARAASKRATRVRAAAGALRDPSVIALAIIAAIGTAVAVWAAGWQSEPAASVSYFGQPTSEDLWPVRLEYLASTVAGSATIAAVGGCIGMLVVIVARLRAR